MEAIEKNQLNERTRLRNDSLWIALDWGGLMTPLANQQAVLDGMAQPGIENFMAIGDETWEIKEYQRDRGYQLEQFGINQDRQIAADKVATGRAKLAIQRATDEYTLAVMVYAAKVKALLMGAKEFAAQVELEQLEVERQRSILAVAKEGLHLKEVTAKIYYEYIQRAMVEADIAKSQVEVAKAHVRAVMADIAAGEADIRVIQAQIEQYIAQADKASLQAEVAMIFARILTFKLNGVKLDVGQKEIAAGFGYIQSRLDDALTRMQTQKIEEGIKIDFEGTALTETNRILVDEKASEDLREVEMQDLRDVFIFTEAVTGQNIQDETALRQRSVTAKEALSDQKLAVREAEDTKKTWAQVLIDDAHKYTYKGAVRISASQLKRTTEETISSG
jgi:hypothetical protein